MVHQRSYNVQLIIVFGSAQHNMNFESLSRSALLSCSPCMESFTGLSQLLEYENNILLTPVL
jgi:hypothetical protein